MGAGEWEPDCHVSNWGGKIPYPWMMGPWSEGLMHVVQRIHSAELVSLQREIQDHHKKAGQGRKRVTCHAIHRKEG